MILSLYKGNIGRDKKDKKVSLQLNVYQKNARAISFYQREGFSIQCEGLDEAISPSLFNLNTS
ncbi:hypothetical protein GPK82_16100 [Coprococcus catus]|nr:hypothetical protein [Coprococcus catus]